MTISAATREVLMSRPELIAMAAPDVGSVMRWGALAAGAAGTLLFQTLRGHIQIPDGCVAIRTRHNSALRKDGTPRHALLEPGGHWVLPYIHGYDLVNIQDQSAPIATTVDLGPVDDQAQYNLEALATWGVIRQKSSGLRPTVSFEDAYNFFYGIDSMEDAGAIVAAATTRFLCESAEELEPHERNRGILHEYANLNLTALDLTEYGLEVRHVDVTQFSLAGVVRVVGDNSVAARL